MTDGICQTCSLCCKLLGVLELEKPPLTWCRHCAPGGAGCTVYETRPTSCQTYECLYYTLKDRGEPVPDLLRPARCHAVIDASLDGTEHSVRVDPRYRRDVWKNQDLVRMILALVSHGPVWLVEGDVRRQIRQTGSASLAIDHIVKG